MIETNESQPKLSRRRFGVLALGGAGALAAGAVTTLRIFDDGDDSDAAPRAFELYYDPAVYVTMTNGQPFVVQVKEQGTGKVLEHHGTVTASNFFSLDSDYMEIFEVPVVG